MLRFSRALAALLLAIVAAGPFGAAAAAQQAVAAAQPFASISGSVADTTGAPLSGAGVRLAGPAQQSTTTDAAGQFTFNAVVPGVYNVLATKAGYDAAAQADYAVLPGAKLTGLTITLAAATLSSIREIGRVAVNRQRSTFNAGPASVAIVAPQVFADEGLPQVQRVLDQTPGIVIDHPGTSANNAAPGAITFPSIRGGLGFETASLIDGHPLAVGNFGDYVTTFLNAYALSGVELIKGPGAAAPEVNYAIGGTVNFRTLEPTRTPHGQIVLGTDSFGGQFSNFRYTGSTNNNRLSYALDYAINGSPGPLKDANGLVTLSSSTLVNCTGAQFTAKTCPGQNGFTTNPPANASTNGFQNNPFYATSTLLACCMPVNTLYNNKTELVKLRYKLSDATVATASYLGSQTYTDQNGNHVYQYYTQFVPGAGYAGNLPAGPQPTWQNVFWPANEWEINNEPIFQAEIRSTLGKDTVLARYYTASINRLQYNFLNNPSDTYTTNLNVYGTYTSTQAGNPTVALNGQSVPVTFIGQYFRSAEEDKLHGASFEYDHFAGNNTYTLAYDNTSSNTHAYDYDGSGNTPSVAAGSRQTFGTLLLRGIFNLTPKFSATLSNYLDTYSQRFTPDGGLTFQTANSNRYDGRLGLAYRPNGNISYRAAAGSAVAPPYLNLLDRVTSAPKAAPGNTSATNTINSGNLLPETSFGYDVGGDIRFGPGSATILSFDLYTTNLRNQFITSTFVGNNGALVSVCPTNTTANAAGLCAAKIGPAVPPITVPLYTTAVQNLGQARYEGLEASIKRDPALGFGFTAQGALLRAYPVNIPACFYSTSPANCSQTNTNLAIVAGANYFNSGTGGSPGSFNAVSNHAEPYSQGYAEVHYRWLRNGYAGLGATYYGNNNSLNVPAFVTTNASFRYGFDERTTFQISVDNLNGAYAAPYISPFGGVPVPLVNGKLGLTNANVIGPRTVRFILTREFGAK